MTTTLEWQLDPELQRKFNLRQPPYKANTAGGEYYFIAPALKDGEPCGYAVTHVTRNPLRVRGRGLGETLAEAQAIAQRHRDSLLS